MKILYRLNSTGKIDSIEEYLPRENEIISEAYSILEITKEEYDLLINNYGYIVKDNKLIFIGESQEEEQKQYKEKRYYEIKEIIKKNKEFLEQTDYKIIKCYESFMGQFPLPYNLKELSAQREAWRAEINQLEEELKAL
jgi:hypothetical protein